MSIVTEDDFFAGVMAALALRGTRSISLRRGRFDSAMKVASEELRKRADQLDLEVDFRIKPHPIHGTSSTLQSCISSAVQADIISLDNPEYQDLTVKLDEEEAHAMFKWLPGNEALYEDITDKFIRSYFAFEPSTA